MFHFLLCKSDY